MGELANCPFCGSDCLFWTGDGEDRRECRHCGGSAPRDVWNTRADPLRERLEELVAEWREEARHCKAQDALGGEHVAISECADELAAILGDTP